MLVMCFVKGSCWELTNCWPFLLVASALFAGGQLAYLLLPRPVLLEILPCGAAVA